jgi:hypothetical protein
MALILLTRIPHKHTSETPEAACYFITQPETLRSSFKEFTT